MKGGALQTGDQNILLHDFGFYEHEHCSGPRKCRSKEMNGNQKPKKLVN